MPEESRFKAHNVHTAHGEGSVLQMGNTDVFLIHAQSSTALGKCIAFLEEKRPMKLQFFKGESTYNAIARPA